MGNSYFISKHGHKLIFKILSKILLFLILTVLIYLISLKLAQSIERTDFPAFFNAAKIMLDKQGNNSDIYKTINFDSSLETEDFNYNLYYIYSMAAAYMLSPLAFLSYFQAKAFFITLNILCYFFSIALFLKTLGCVLSWQRFIFGSFCLWIPFLYNIAGSQINPIIFFILVLASYLLEKGYLAFCGSLIAIAALFKLSPLIIAGIVGVKFRPIIFVCLLVFMTTFLIPGSIDWIAALKTLPNKTAVVGYTPIYNTLTPAWFGLYALTVFSITAIIAMRCPSGDSTWFIAVGQVIAFLIMPVVEYHHLVLLAIPILYLGFSRQIGIGLFWRSVLALVPVILINLVVFLPFNFPFFYLAILYLWAVLLVTKLWRRMPSNVANSNRAIAK